VRTLTAPITLSRSPFDKDTDNVDFGSRQEKVYVEEGKLFIVNGS